MILKNFVTYTLFVTLMFATGFTNRPLQKAASKDESVSEKSDIILFMVDQLSAKWLEYAWEGVCPTPNLDRLKEMGTAFPRCFTSNPVCQPARATIATGLSTRGHGVLENGYQLDPGLSTFMQVLRENGWRTGAFGKVHLKPHFAGLYPDYKPYGFDVTHITEDPRGGEWLDWVGKNHPGHYEAALATIWPTGIPEFAAYGEEKVNLRARIIEVRSSFKWATEEFPQNTQGAYTLPFPEEVSQTCWITMHALEFIKGTPHGKPVFAQVSYVQPHGPKCPPGEYMKYVDTTRIPAPLPPEWVDDPDGPYELKRRKPVIYKNWRQVRQYYFADIVHLDKQLGRILDAQKERGRLNQTYIIFLADHGEMFGDHGFAGKEEKHYDACIRIPLIIAGPGL